jgi:hypothetical protein
MIYANKKINQSSNSAQQTAQIITNVSALESKNLIRLTTDTVFLHPQLWKDKKTAINWMNCLHLYYIVKKGFKKSGTLNFKDIESEELIGTLINSKPKVLIFS